MLESKGRERAIFEEIVIEKLSKLRKEGIEYTYLWKEREFSGKGKK